jgi:DNA-binding transcriptional ArsR family regulator
MPVVDGPQAPASALLVEVESSVAVELEWAMGSALHPDWLDDHLTLRGIYDAHPELAEALRRQWTDELATSCGGFLELDVLAHHAGLLFSTDGHALLDALAEAAATLPADAPSLSLRSESQEDRRVLLQRLAQLRRSKARRQRYVELVRRVWEVVRPDWEARGRASTDEAVRVRRRAAAGGTPWQEVADSACFSDQLATTVAATGPHGRVVVVPAYYTHKGMFVELDGTVVVGVRSESDGAAARARTERLARQLKTIADPTRLAILDTLRRGPRTVTELAEAFTLAQPTVSNHVKILRDAGMVSDVRDGKKRRLVVRPDEVERLMGGLEDVLAAPAGVSVQA